MIKKLYDRSTDVARLKLPVMPVTSATSVTSIYRDSNNYRPEHVVKLYQLLGSALKDVVWQRHNKSRNRLAILPHLTPYDIVLSPQLTASVLPRLECKISSVKWAKTAGKKL